MWRGRTGSGIPISKSATAAGTTLTKTTPTTKSPGLISDEQGSH